MSLAYEPSWRSVALRRWHLQGSLGHILALAFNYKSFDEALRRHHLAMDAPESSTFHLEVILFLFITLEPRVE